MSVLFLFRPIPIPVASLKGHAPMTRKIYVSLHVNTGKVGWLIQSRSVCPNQGNNNNNNNNNCSMVLHRNWSRSGTGKAETHNHPRWSAVAHLSITVPISSKQINKRTTGYVQPLKTGAQQILFNVLCHRPATLWLTIAGRNEATEHIVRDTSCFGKWSFRASSNT